jgi:hypothetical protein
MVLVLLPPHQPKAPGDVTLLPGKLSFTEGAWVQLLFRLLSAEMLAPVAGLIDALLLYMVTKTSLGSMS